MPDRDHSLLVPAGILGGNAVLLVVFAPFAEGSVRLFGVLSAAASAVFASYFVVAYRRGDQTGRKR